jgi:KAP family P-loop domain
MELKLIPDRAIGEASLEAKDGLGFGTYANVLAQAARGTPGPFTIGVFGEWGTGKTSLMRLVQTDLDTSDNVVTVWFNAWRFEKEEHPIVPLVGTIIQELEKYQPKKAKLKDSTRGLIRALRAVAYGFSAKSTVKVPGFAEVEASFVAKDMIDRREQITPDPLLDRSLYYGAFNALESIELPEDLRIVVLIDDLDRCFPNQAIRLLESIKLVLAQRGFIFVLGVARQVIEGYLQHRYATEFGIKDFKGQLYLDKIVQLPFHIPPNAGRMDEFCARVLEGQPPDIAQQLGATLPTIAEALGGNPRAVIRFINNILIDMAISSALTAAASAEEIPVDFFAISRCLEHRWPEVYVQLTTSDQLAAHVASWPPDAVASKAEGAGPEARIAVLLNNDQRLTTLLLSDSGRSWLSNSDLRSASVSFLVKQSRLSSEGNSGPAEPAPYFVSFDREDEAAILILFSLLTRHRVMLLTDNHVDKQPDALEMRHQMVSAARGILLCIGAGAVQERLDDLLFQNHADVRKIRPVLLPGASDKNVPNIFRSANWLDLRDGIDPARVERFVALYLQP